MTKHDFAHRTAVAGLAHDPQLLKTAQKKKRGTIEVYFLHAELTCNYQGESAQTLFILSHTDTQALAGTRILNLTRLNIKLLQQRSIVLLHDPNHLS